MFRYVLGRGSFFAQRAGEGEEDPVVVLRGEVAHGAPEDVTFEGYCDLSELFVGEVAIQEVEEERVAAPQL